MFRKAVLGVLILVAAAGIIFSHFFILDLEQVTAEPERYKFGAESMISAGGAQFRSLSAYVVRGAWLLAFSAWSAGVALAFVSVILVNRLRKKSVYLMALLAAGLSSQNARATADGPDAYCVRGVAASDVLNLRDSPTLKGKVIAKIPANTCKIENLVAIADRFGNAIKEGKFHVKPFWLKVRYRNHIGWVALRYLREDNQPL